MVHSLEILEPQEACSAMLQQGEVFLVNKNQTVKPSRCLGVMEQACLDKVGRLFLERNQLVDHFLMLIILYLDKRLLRQRRMVKEMRKEVMILEKVEIVHQLTLIKQVLILKIKLL